MSQIAKAYGHVMRDPAYEQFAGGYVNYGLWTSATKSPAEACHHLVDTLFAKLPERGRVLDVAFGKGVSTKRLEERYGAENVAGINIDADQVQIARERGVTCDLRVMDAAKPDFPSESFDAILCIESAFHFQSRAQFLAEAHRMLRPSGVLVMSDILFRTGHGLDPEVFPPENHVSSVDEYRRAYVAAGFSPESVAIDVSSRQQIYPLCAAVAGAFDFFRGRAPGAEPQANGGQAFTAVERFWASFIVSRLVNIQECVLVAARK
uniref:O-methyltransferase n=1 Tax=Sorangium cellulosum TaxID=56 RepID=Q8GBX3_SORCE|nr:OH-methyltransferase [Sorangium cellulosum]CAL58688.1 O-methyltransferase [Sorangium cellulosum]